MPAAWLAQGIAVHEAIERWERTYREHGIPEAHAWFDEAWDREILKALEREPDTSKWLCPGRAKPDVDIENRFKRGREQVAGYIAQARKSRLVPVEYLPGEPAVELSFELDLDGVKVVGAIDLILVAPDDRLLVRDIKTGSKRPSSPIQLAVYRHAVMEVMGEDVHWGDYYMAKDGAPTDPIDLRPFTRDLVTRWFQQMDAAEREGIYLPNPGDHCKVCSVRRFCSVMGTDRLSFSPDSASPQLGE